MIFLRILIVSLVLMGCATPPPVVYTYPTKEEVRFPDKDFSNKGQVDIEVPIFSLPDEKATSSKSKSDTTLVLENQNNYRVTARKATFFGGAVIYNYIPNHVYQLFCKPFALTDISLEPGEKLTSPVVAGDTMNFMVATGSSIEDGVEQVHIYVKPLYAGKSTTLAINTNRRSYRFDVCSYNTIGMSIITFGYPLDDMKKASLPQSRPLTTAGGADITALNYNYKIIPMSKNRPAWMPSIIFNDGKRTYINFASAERASYAPVLFEMKGKKRNLLNYRVEGNYYIIDSLPKQMELALDINADNIVSILYEGR